MSDEGRTGKVKMANPREYDYLYEPYWGPVDANIDWCEKNYQFTSYIAELKNATSSGVILCLGLYFLFQLRSMKLTERRLHLLGWLLTLTGLGSMLFHGTLKWWAQWMDEVPMMIGNFIVIFALLEDQATRKYKYLAHFLAMMVVATLVIYALFPQYFEIFFFIYTGFLFVALLLFFRVYTNSECPKTFRYLLHCTLFFLGGGFVLWILENLYCHSAPPPVENLHAIWHVMSGTGVFCGVEAFVLLRAKALGREYNVSRMAYTGIPIVVVEPVKAE